MSPFDRLLSFLIDYGGWFGWVLLAILALAYHDKVPRRIAGVIKRIISSTRSYFEGRDIEKKITANIENLKPDTAKEFFAPLKGVKLKHGSDESIDRVLYPNKEVTVQMSDRGDFAHNMAIAVKIYCEGAVLIELRKEGLELESYVKKPIALYYSEKLIKNCDKEGPKIVFFDEVLTEELKDPRIRDNFVFVKDLEAEGLLTTIFLRDLDVLKPFARKSHNERINREIEEFLHSLTQIKEGVPLEFRGEFLKCKVILFSFSKVSLEGIDPYLRSVSLSSKEFSRIHLIGAGARCVEAIRNVGEHIL